MSSHMGPAIQNARNREHLDRLKREGRLPANWHETPAEARDGLAAQEAQDDQDPGDDDPALCADGIRRGHDWGDWITEDEDRDELAEHIASGGRPPFYRPKEYDE